MDFFPLHKKSNQCCVGSFLKCLLNLFISSLLPLSLGFYCLFHGWLSETFIYLPLVSLFANFRPIFIILTYAIKLILTISHNSYYAIIVMYLNYCFGHVIAYMRKLNELPFPSGPDADFLMLSYLYSLTSRHPVPLTSQL